MQTATIRIYDDAACRNLKTETCIPRVQAMEQILAGFRAAMEIQTAGLRSDDLWNRARWLRWAGYDPYEVAALLGEQHLTRVQLYPAIGGHRYEYVLPDGLSPVECDDLCLYVIGEDEDTDQKQELLVTSALASVLHADGVSLENHTVDFARGWATRIDELAQLEINGENVAGFVPIGIVPAGLPATLSAAVRARGWQKTVEWLRDTQAMLERHLEEISLDRAVWVPESEPRPPWEPLILRPLDGGGCLRLALSADVDAESGVETNEYISLSEAANMANIRPQNVGRQAAKKGLLKYVGDHPVIERKGWCELRKIDPTKLVRRQHRIEKPKAQQHCVGDPEPGHNWNDHDIDDQIVAVFDTHAGTRLHTQYILEMVQKKYKDARMKDVIRVLMAGKKREDYREDDDGNWLGPTAK